MDDTYLWSETRDQAIDKFAGQTPGAQVEQDIRQTFEHHPRRVIAEIDRVAGKLAAGAITSAWPILRLNVKELEGRPDVAVTDSSERTRVTWRAEKWIRASGIFFNSEAEVEDELFGPHGMLRDFANDELLTRRMLELWEAERPRGEVCELEAVERGARFVAKRAELARKLNEAREQHEQPS